MTSDWATLFPAFAVWRPLRLLRRVGPWVQGITLERSSSGDDYLPIAHVHALTREFPVISLTLASPLQIRGVQQSIRVRDHAQSYVDAARRLADTSSLPLDRAPTLPELLYAYRTFVIDHPANGIPAAYAELEDMASAPAVLTVDTPIRDGVVLADAVADALALAEAEASSWCCGPPGFATPADWVDQIRARAGDPAALADCVVRQTVAHKLAKLPSAWR